MGISPTTTFHVSDVTPAADLLPELPYKQAVESLLKPDAAELNQFLFRGGRRKSGGIPRLPSTGWPVESCSRYHGRLVDGVIFHPVVAAAHLAFTDHRPLCLSPDMIWLMICQGVANHINARAEELRPRLVRHQGQVSIDVRRDDFIKGSPENPWAEVFGEFSAKIRDHVGPAVDRFLPAFSTTGPVERAAAEVVLLDAVRSYFQYDFATFCGIPAITLEGMTSDWQLLAERAEAFAELGLTTWIEVLRPILGQFIRASRGDVEPSFWRSLYKFNDESGGPAVTGWITVFFPYLKTHEKKIAGKPNRYLFKKRQKALDAILYLVEDRDAEEVFSGPAFDSLPIGLSMAPFRWNHLDQTFDMEFLGGFVGVAQDDRTLALRPEIGWAVRQAKAARPRSS